MSEIIGDRIKIALSLNQMRQATLCKACGISFSAMCQYAAGAVTPNPERIKKMAEVLKVREGWLAGHDVEMSDGDPATAIISQEEVDLIKLYRKLNASGKAEAMIRMDELGLLKRYTD
ncbi:helix-turn-helix transcriptional regulator [Eubacterium sp. 1001713B170207_170306_E7]|uniref:helix-turn-helix domain-containing protein n=1 Tax=Eubacterium sp. 1001713B170207_170306_E7 TaxID=2787097 RepID=UPI00189C222B|nr:helix-turn-helix transcriptional regulator [Eubacterium sp. 1001713B170207_170306_E7]